RHDLATAATHRSSPSIEGKPLCKVTRRTCLVCSRSVQARQDSGSGYRVQRLFSCLYSLHIFMLLAILTYLVGRVVERGMSFDWLIALVWAALCSVVLIGILLPASARAVISLSLTSLVMSLCLVEAALRLVTHSGSNWVDEGRATLGFLHACRQTDPNCVRFF